MDLVQKTCSCRYWQLSGLPCPHAISCIYFMIHKLDEYIAPCFSVEEFKKTYSHYLQPVEGMHSWPVSEREKPEAPPYVWMPGRPKKERRRESTEKSKPNRMCRIETIIRCRICKGIGHNKTSCNKMNGSSSATASAPFDVAPAAPNAMVVVSNTQQSAASAQVVSSSRKRSSQFSAEIDHSQVFQFPSEKPFHVSQVPCSCYTDFTLFLPEL